MGSLNGWTVVRSGTGDPSGEGAAGDVVLVEADDDAVVARCCGQVGHGAGAVLIVLAADLRLGRPLHGQGQPPCSRPRPHTLSINQPTSTVPLQQAPPPNHPSTNQPGQRPPCPPAAVPTHTLSIKQPRTGPLQQAPPPHTLSIKQSTNQPGQPPTPAGTFSSILGDDGEGRGPVGGAVAQAGAERCHMTAVDGVHVELERTSCGGGGGSI